MKIVFSDHAKEQLKERKIPKRFVLDTISNPEDQEKGYRGRSLLRRQFDGKILEVVMVVEDEQLIIITQYYLDWKGML